MTVREKRGTEMKTRLQDRFTRVDAVAFLAFLALWIYYIVIVRYGVCYPDESAYISFAERFMHGERPLIDEWNTAQIASLLLCPLCRVYTALVGSNDGILLFMRYLFAAFNAAFFWCMYIPLRKWRWHALIATILFCAYIPGGLFACNYYTVPIRLLMLVCLILFSDRQKPLPLLAAGVLLAVSVLQQPGLALLYLVYSVLVWIRFFKSKKGKPFWDEYSFCLRMRAWQYISLTAALCAVVFFCWLTARCGLRTILTYLPYVFTDPEYDYSAHGGAWIIFFRKLAVCVQIYGAACAICALVILVLSVVWACGKLRSRRAIWQKLLFGAACAVWIWSCVQPFFLQTESFPDIFFKVYPAPLFWFGFACYLLCEQKNKPLFFFWIVGLLSSLCIDVCSEVAISVGVPISFLADTVFFTDLVGELRREVPLKKAVNMTQLRSRKKEKLLAVFVRRMTQLTCACFAVCFVLLLACENTVVPEHFIRGTPLASLAVTCEKGPCRSIRYPQSYGKYYSDSLSDIDTLKQKQPKNLFIYGMAPELYLYADLPYAAYSCWTWRYMPNLIERQILFWTLQPERLPECIYVPFFEPFHALDTAEDLTQEPLSQIREYLDPICSYTMETGKAGYILYVSHWDTDAGIAAQQ